MTVHTQLQTQLRAWLLHPFTLLTREYIAEIYLTDHVARVSDDPVDVGEGTVQKPEVHIVHKPIKGGC